MELASGGAKAAEAGGTRMRRFSHLAVLPGVFVGLALAAGTAPAQAPVMQRPLPPGYGSPTVSPYINLLNRNNPQFLNYYGIVRPEVQTQNALQGLQQQVGTLEETPALGTGAAVLPTTGHRLAFGYFGGHFGRLYVGGAAGQAGFGGAAGGGAPAAAGGAVAAGRPAATGAPAMAPRR
jgi:hypothetical protein